jgi:hypothetical protein
VQVLIQAMPFGQFLHYPVRLRRLLSLASTRPSTGRSIK